MMLMYRSRAGKVRSPTTSSILDLLIGSIFLFISALVPAQGWSQDFKPAAQSIMDETAIRQNMAGLRHQSYLVPENGYFFSNPDDSDKSYRKTRSQHYAEYNQIYRELNADPWFMITKKVVPFCVSCAMFGVVPTINLATLSLLPMYMITQTVVSIFNAGQDIGDAYESHYRDRTGTTTDVSPGGSGHLAGGLTIGVIDLTLDMYFNQNIPNIEKLSFTETFARFSKSIAITGKLNKALVAYVRDYLVATHQVEPVHADALAEAGAATMLSALLSLTTYSGISNSHYSDSFVSREQILQVAKVTSEQLTIELRQDALRQLKAELKMSGSQQFGRYAREEIPRASTVTAAYSTFEAVKKVCKSSMKTMGVGTDDAERERLCLGISSITTMGASWLTLYSESWLKPGFVRVYFENLSEAGGLGMTELAMNLAGIFSEKNFPEEPVIRDIFKMSAGVSSFSVFYAANLANPAGSFINNARSGAHLMVVLEGTEISMSHAGPILFVSNEILMDVIRQLPYETDLNLKNDLDTGRYSIPILDHCMVMSRTGMTTESYALNQGCNVPTH